MGSPRHIYLQMKSLEEAQSLFFNRFSFETYLQSQTISSREAAGRVTAVPVSARFSSPSYHAAAMDGIALCAETTFGTTVDRPKRLRIGKDAFFVNTGQIMPDGTDAVGGGRDHHLSGEAFCDARGTHQGRDRPDR